AYTVRGKAYRGKGDSERAIQDFDEAIKINGKDYEALMNRGLAFRDRGDTDRAAQDLESAVTLDRKNTNTAVLNTLSHIYYDKRDYERAINALNLAIKINPNYALAFYNRGMAYRAKGEPDRAIPDYDRAIKLNPNDTDALHSRGLAYRDIRDYERAIQDFDA